MKTFDVKLKGKPSFTVEAKYCITRDETVTLHSGGGEVGVYASDTVEYIVPRKETTVDELKETYGMNP